MPATKSRKKTGEHQEIKSPTEADAPNAPVVRMTLLDQIERDDRNHRLVQAQTAEKVKALAESMKTEGQQQPVQVFEYPADKIPGNHPYLLVFGFRRCAAAEINGWNHIAATVKPMPVQADGTIDRMAIERARGIENLQREDLNPIEECLLVQQIADALPTQLNNEAFVSRDEDGRLTDAAVVFVANAIGRTEAWVRDRLYLDRLSPAVKELVMNGKLFLIYAREIAKLADHAEQESIALMCEADPKDGHCSTTIHQVRRYVSNRQNSLRGVPWQLDREFPKHKCIVGSCATCPFNTSNDKKLFEHDETPNPEGYCLKTSCYDAKRAVTDKAVELAVSKIVKLGKPATEKSATEVAPEFVKPGRVARQVKKLSDNTPAKEPKQEVAYWETPEYKAKQALNKAEEKWWKEADKTIMATFKDHPGRLAALLLVMQTGVIKYQMKPKELQKARLLLKATVDPSHAAITKLEKQVIGRRDMGLSTLGLHNKDVVVAALAECYGIELNAYPTLKCP